MTFDKDGLLIPAVGETLYVYDFDDTLTNTCQVLNEEDLWPQLNCLIEEPTGPDHVGLMVSDLSRPHWPMLELATETRKHGRNIILSGRNAAQIEYWLKKNKQRGLFDKVFGLGALANDVAEAKHKILLEFSPQFDLIVLYDDHEGCVDLANSIHNVKAVRVKKASI